ncbi:DUF3658 domain-containing protein [Bacillus testis]|uniref:DUF3658 domain-containing protein n=1 Tax=Bacillus testis TaxID=1622072 RepID=UPI00067EFC30|nr:DUF3658 domain-containing protein [Bacillus testis]
MIKEERALYADEWKELSASNAVLRIWENGAIRHVDEDFFDDFIIRSAQRLHQEADSCTFMPAARLIGEVLGHIDQYIEDAFLQYRVRQLIEKGIFGLKGVPKAMRFYWVRLYQR